MDRTLIKNATIVNEGRIFQSDLLLQDGRIHKIATDIGHPNAMVVEAEGRYVLPGMIDDQVHFREPGLTHKATIASESRAAVAGGITSFMEQPNTVPQTTTIEKLEEKFAIAQQTSFANYSFLLGGTNDNLEELKRLDKRACSGIKLFLGSSTGNMLVDDEEVLEKIFRSTDMVISAHREDEETIRSNMSRYKDMYVAYIPVASHPLIRSADACYLSSSRAVVLSQKTGARLHVFHVSTWRETQLFKNDLRLPQQKITADA